MFFKNKFSYSQIFTTVLLLFILFNLISCEDKKATEFKQCIIPIRSINPDDTNFSDLSPLKKIIGNAEIVMLGEITHGDGSAMDAKIRLIKFLHEQMGFDILAFESSMYECRRAWLDILEKKDSLTPILKSIFPIWTMTTQILPLTKYISNEADSTSPLELCGFDCQFGIGLGKKMPGYAAEFFGNDINEYLKSLNLKISLSEKINFVQNFIKEFVTNGNFKISPDSIIITIGFLDEIIQNIEEGKLSKTSEQIYYLQLLKSFNGYLSMGVNQSRGPNIGGINTRDRQMADNLIWLKTNFYQNKKIIVWAANYHIEKMPDSVTSHGFGAIPIQMGKYLTDYFADKIFAIAITSCKGERRNIETGEIIKISKPIDNSINYYFYQSNYDYGYCNLNNPSIDRILPYKFDARIPDYSFLKINWRQSFDGILFIRNMEPTNLNQKILDKFYKE